MRWDDENDDDDDNDDNDKIIINLWHSVELPSYPIA